MRPMIKDLCTRASAAALHGSLREASSNAIEIICAGLAQERKLSRAYMQELMFMSSAPCPEESQPWQDFLDVFERIAAKTPHAVGSDAQNQQALAQTLFSVFYSTTISWIGGALPSLQARKALVERMLDMLVDTRAPRTRIHSTPPVPVRIAQLRG
jgi:hypothetical protein